MWDVSKGNKMSRKRNFGTLARVLCDLPNTSHQCQEGPGDDSKTPAVRVFLFDVMFDVLPLSFPICSCQMQVEYSEQGSTSLDPGLRSTPSCHKHSQWGERLFVS